MTPEAAGYLGKAREHLAAARGIMTLPEIFVPLPNIAAREAYVAAYQAAQAYIFERSGKIAKSHGGLRSEFSRLAQTDQAIDPELMSFLGRAYRQKENSDYAIGSALTHLRPEEAERVIADASRFVDTIAATLASGGPR